MSNMKVQYITHMGDDLLVANAARKSFGKDFTEFSYEPRSKNGRSDDELIQSLADDGHWLPFRHPHIILACSEALPIARQLGKHQVGLEWSEISRRYKTKDIKFTYLDNEWRADVKDRRQGSGEKLDVNRQAMLAELQAKNIANCLGDYGTALDLGAAPEQARYLLPQSMNAEWTWTGSLLAYAHIYNQRNHPDAQKEVRDFAIEAANIIEPLYPVSWKALTQKGDK